MRTTLLETTPRVGHADAPPATPLLRVEGLRRSYGGRLVVDIDTLELRDGEVLVVLGPNGAGKSTLFRLLLLLEKADAGCITLDGRVVRYGDRTAQRRMAGVFQRPFLFEGTVEQNVAFGLRARGVPARERAARVAEALHWLEATHLARAAVDTLSGGEAQRIALARALALRPEVLFLDEPTANLDISVRRAFRADLAELVRTRTRAALVITHDPIDAFTLADRIAVVQSGRVVQLGRPEELVTRPATTFIAALTGAEFLSGGVVRAREAEEITVELPGGVRLMAASTNTPPPIGAPVQLAYHPEEIELSRASEFGLPGSGFSESGAGEPRNRLRLRVAGLNPAGAMVHVRLAGAVSLTASATRRSIASLGLTPGDDVVARIEPSALHLFPVLKTAAERTHA